jgi:predicted small metal-binding protein
MFKFTSLTLTLSYRDAEFDCDYIVEGQNEDELFRKGEKHAFNAHGMKKQDLF